MASLRFRATMRIIGVNPYVLVTAQQARTLKEGWRRPMPVLVRINGKPDQPWRINMMPRGDGNFYLYLHGSVRKASRTKVGDDVSVALRFDAAYRGGPMHPMPSWFRIPLSENKKAKKAWDALTPSRKKEILRYLSALKSKEARLRNLVRMMWVLSGKKARFMARTWQNGS
jgi:hypothetical protein